MSPLSRIRNFGNWISSFFSENFIREKDIPESAPEAPSFPQFALLPAELRVLIFRFALLPSPSSIIIHICPLRWEAAATPSYNSTLLESTTRCSWQLAFVQNPISDVLFTCKDAFYGGEPHYCRVLFSGSEITDKDLVPAMMNSRGEVDSYKYDGYLPAAKDSKQRYLWIGRDDTLIFKPSRTIPWDLSNPPHSYAISPQQPLNISNVRHVVMNFSLFFTWARASSHSTPISFKGVEVLYLLDETSPDHILPTGQNILEELLLEGEQKIRGIKEIMFVRSRKDLPQERQVGW